MDGEHLSVMVLAVAVSSGWGERREGGRERGGRE